MKILFIVAVAAIALSACNNTDNQSKESTVKTGDTTLTPPAPSKTNNESSIKEMVTAYLQLKNALANDNSKEAATAGGDLQAAIEKADAASFSAAQKKVFNEVSEDAKEHAAHIAANGSNIVHQREHFETLSQDLYDLVKAFGSSQTLYQTHCPMYNNNKGANWLSETKEIKNPYLGAKMSTCGEVKEEI
jgi:hypothetical protein